MDNTSQLFDLQTAAADGEPKQPGISTITLLITILVVVLFIIPAAGYLVSQL